MIALCMITKNEEKFLANALDSVRELVSEIVIVDTGSTDKTVEIAKKYNAKIFNFKWIDNFSAARNYSLEQAKQPWILVLDADETIDKEHFDKIKEVLKNAPPDFLGMSVTQYNYTNDKNNVDFIPLPNPYKGFTGYVPAEIVRIFKNNPKIRFEGAVHETVKESISRLNGKIMRSDLPVHHFQFSKGNLKEKQLKYLEIYEKNLDSYPNKAKAYRDIAVIYFNFKNDYNKAIEYFKKSLELEQHLTSYIGLGWSYIKLKLYDNAIETFNSALKIQKSFILYKSLGVSYMFNKNYEQALENLKIALKLNPKDEETKKLIEDIKTPNYSLNIQIG